MEENDRITLDEAVSKAAWCHNTNITVKGYAPLQLLTGRAVVVPGITSGNVATESLISESEAIRRHIENQKEVNKKYREIEYVNKPNSKRKFVCFIKLEGGKTIEVDFENEIRDWKYLINEKEEETEVRETKENFELDNIGTYWMKMSNDECLVEEITTYVVEVPKSRHHEPEVINAKEKELENFEYYEAFEEVKDTGQEKIGSRWVITEKERQDGQKTKIKARLVARGFQETEKPKSDSPTALRESFKTFIAVSANEGFELESVDISAAFLQAEKLERDVFVEPPKDVKQEGTIWKLKKPIYGLEDAGKREFVDMIKDLLMKNFTISKVESSEFRFTGIDIVKTREGIEVSMEDYAQSIEEIKEIRKIGNDEPLTKTEYKVFRKYAGKIQWLAENVRPDLAIVGIQRDSSLSDEIPNGVDHLEF
ncbi:titin-like [Palaemon carinicauda]|uniref:titin-like n=1 Tax=Palaemon carinicauda TaxID=392227 RepID=UPI0035B60E4A